MIANRLGWAVVAALLVAASGQAAVPLLISPTLIEIPAGRHAASVEITNRSDEPVDLQVRGLAWTQGEAGDRLEPSGDLVLSPAIATIPGRGTQLFRVLDTGASAAGERAFRLRINELPRPGPREAITINLEFLVPVFRLVGTSSADLRWRQSPAGLELGNAGGRRLRIVDATMVEADGHRLPIEAARSSYLLAGSRRRFAAPGVPIARVEASTDQGTIIAAPMDPAR